MDREAINQRLHELWMQTADPTILQYIQSGWTTPVSPAVQQQVGLIVGHPVPSTGPPAGPPAQQPQPGPAPAASSYQATRVPSSAGTSIDAPQSVALPDPSGGLPLGLGLAGGAASARLNSEPTPGFGGPNGVNVQTGYGYEGPPTNIGQGLGGLFAGDPGLTNGPYASPPKINIAQGNGPGGAVSQAINNAQNRVQQAVSAGRNPASGGSTVNPLFPGASAAGGGSAVQDAGYQAAMGGDQNALDLVLGKLLSNYGVDVTRPGLFTGSLVKSVAPYLETFLRYYGLNGAGEPARDRARAAAEEFGGMLGSGGTFGQIQNAARNTLGGVGDLLGNARGALADPMNQQGIVKDLLGMLTAGNNAISQQSDLGQLLGANYDYGQEQLGGATGGYMDFLRRQAGTGRLPGGDLLAQILGGTTAGR